MSSYPKITIVQDTEQTLHRSRHNDKPGSALCGFPPRKRDGTRWLLTDSPANERPLNGSPDDMTCVWCRAAM